MPNDELPLPPTWPVIPANTVTSLDTTLGHRQRRVLVMIVADASGAMLGAPGYLLHEWMRQLIADVQADPHAIDVVELSIISYGETVELALPFTLTAYCEIPNLHCGGIAPMGATVTLAIDLVRRRNLELQALDISCYRPCLITIASGYPNDGNIWKSVAARISVETSVGLLSFSPIFTVDDVNADNFHPLKPGRYCHAPRSFQAVRAMDIISRNWMRDDAELLDLGD